MTRDDLLTLTPDALAALANRGLVKRAAKALDAGTAPAIEVGEDGTVHGRFDDGVTAALPLDADLQTASCTCAAPGVCRHRIGLVLAYQRQFARPTADEDSAPFTPWSPGAVDDDTLTALYGAPALAAARRTLTSGFPARLVRATPADPVARAELRSCTVRFLVPGEVRYAHTDAADAARHEMIVLAVWAFRAADERGLDAGDVPLDVGGAPQDPAAPGTDPGLAAVLALVDDLLLDGARHAGAVATASLRRAARDLDGQGLRWPAAALTDLVAQLDAYRDRTTGHRPERLAELLTELHARHRATVNGGAGPRSRVLGSDEPVETPLRRVRLTGLGCRIGGTDTERTAEVFFAHPDSGTVLVLRKRWPVPEPADAPLTGAQLATRRLGGTPLRTLATGQVVSESAARSASRVVRLASSRVARTRVTPLGGTRPWESLPASVTAPDLATLERQLAALPPRLIRPRVEAELVRAVPVAEVRAIGYDPGDQRLDAVIADADGRTALVSATYDGARPAALDCLAAALDGEFGTPRYLSGPVRRAGGRITISPLAVLTDDGPVLPDLAPGTGDTDLAAAPEDGQDPPAPLDDALRAALTACADAAHHGLRHVPAGVRRRLGDAAAGLATVGLHTAAGHVTALSKALTDDSPEGMVATWVEAQIRLLTTAELC
ncbi:hypothetical protein AB0D04_12300 [Streptomyces sp. NPDC048483]|uniref:hypothetical protein n=1 Tax=Streptomyces sp. NPDC048483 TaxID=3154927 RepID=UPI0034436D74